MSKIITKYKYWLILFFVFIILRLPSLFEPYWYGDEGVYLTLGMAIRKGLTLYSQIHDNKPPLLYYLAAIGRTVFGFRLLLFFVMVPTIYYFYRLSLHFFNQKITRIITLIFLIITSIPFLEGNIANAEIFMLLPTILGVYLFLSSRKSYFTYLISGLLLGLAFTLKVPVIIEFGFLFLWLIFSNLNEFKNKLSSILIKLLIFGSSFLIPIILFGIFFALKGAFPLFLNSALLQNFSYLSSWATGSQTASVSSGGLFTRLIVLLFFWLTVFLFKKKKFIDSHFSFLLFWFGATIFGSLLSTRPYPHYLIQVIPPLCLLLPIIFNFREIIYSIITIFCFIAFFLITQKYHFYSFSTLSYYKAFYLSGSINKFHQYFDSDVSSTYEIGQYINQNSSPEDRIFVWGDMPYIYALSNRLPPGRYTVAYHIVDFNGYQETMVALKTHLPKIIIYKQMVGRNFQELDNFLKNYYILDKTISSNLIFKLR